MLADGVGQGRGGTWLPEEGVRAVPFPKHGEAEEMSRRFFRKAARRVRHHLQFGLEEAQSLKDRHVDVLAGTVEPLIGLVLQCAGHLPEGERREAADREKGAQEEERKDSPRDGPAQKGKGRSHDGSGQYLVARSTNAPDRARTISSR